MTTFLEQLTALDNRQLQGGLSEYAYRRAKEQLLAIHADDIAVDDAARVQASVDREAEDDRDVAARGAVRAGRRRKAPANQKRQPNSTGSTAATVGGSPALDALLLFVVAVAFSEFLAQALGNGLPFHRIGDQLIYLPGPAVYLANALEGGGLRDPQLLLAALLTPCYLVIPWGAYRALSKPGGIGQLVAGYTIALRYFVISGIVAYVNLAVFNDYALDVQTHLAIPALIGLVILGTVLALVILLRRLASR
jgi:hypothetical protein